MNTVHEYVLVRICTQEEPIRLHDVSAADFQRLQAVRDAQSGVFRYDNEADGTKWEISGAHIAAIQIVD